MQLHALQGEHDTWRGEYFKEPSGTQRNMPTSGTEVSQVERAPLELRALRLITAPDTTTYPTGRY